MSYKPYRRASLFVERLLRVEWPHVNVQRVSIDEWYLDLTQAAGAVLHHVAGLAWLSHFVASLAAHQAASLAPAAVFEAASTIVSSVRARLREAMGLRCSAGIASNCMLAKLASGRAKPWGQLAVLPHGEAEFMRALPLARLPGCGGRICRTVERVLHATTVQQLLQCSEARVRAALRGIPGGAEKCDRRATARCALPPHPSRTHARAHAHALRPSRWRAAGC